MARMSRVESTLIPLEIARWRLATIWLPSCGFLIIILVAQSIGGAYGDQVQRAWSWALPNFLPTLSLMISALAVDALSDTKEVKSPRRRSFVHRQFYSLSIMLSLFYLTLVLISLIAQPLAGYFLDGPDLAASRLKLLDYSNYWLGPLQGLVAGCIGSLFFTKESEKQTGG